MARAFGILLQIGAAVSFLASLGYLLDPLPVFNRHYMGAIMISGAALFSGFKLFKGRDQLFALEKHLDKIALSWGLLWWFAAGLLEIERHLIARHEIPAILVFLALSCVLAGMCYRRLDWRDMRFPPMGLLPAATLLALLMFENYTTRHPFSAWGFLAWSAMILGIYHLQRLFEEKWPQKLVRTWHAWAFLLIVFLLSWETSWLTNRIIGNTAVWPYVGWALISLLALPMLNIPALRRKWPFRYFPDLFDTWVPMILSGYLTLWGLAAASQSGDPAPLTYIPILNPLDLAQIFSFYVILKWAYHSRHHLQKQFNEQAFTAIATITAIAVFIWLNALLARTVHHFGTIPYTADALSSSFIFHASLSVLWGVLSLCIMVWASRHSMRHIWFAGAGLLALEVLKLFVVDLSGTGSISRIVSFLAVGALILIIGFYSPLPPDKKKEQPI